MRADHAVRHNSAVGALFGLGVGDVLEQCAAIPTQVCAGAIDLSAWGERCDRSFANAEALLRGVPIDMDATASDVVAPALALADPDATPPLLGEPDAVLMCSLIRDGLTGRLDWGNAHASGPDMRAAIEAVRQADTFCEAVSLDCSALTGALAGMRWGPASIPAAWVTSLHGPVGDRIYGLRQLRRLAERLMQLDAPVPPEPRRSLGPREVAPKLWLSNLHAVPHFISQNPEGAVVSLCPTTGAFDDHPYRREFALHDASGRAVNPLLSSVVDEVLASIALFHDEGRDVLVHCHHGASRTGLILRAWLVEELGLNVDDATTEAQVRWSKTSTWNHAFSAEIRRRAERLAAADTTASR